MGDCLRQRYPGLRGLSFHDVQGGFGQRGFLRPTDLQPVLGVLPVNALGHQLPDAQGAF